MFFFAFYYYIHCSSHSYPEHQNFQNQCNCCYAQQKRCFLKDKAIPSPHSHLLNIRVIACRLFSQGLCILLLGLPSYLALVLQHLGAPSMSYVLATTIMADEQLVCFHILHKGCSPTLQAFCFPWWPIMLTLQDPYSLTILLIYFMILIHSHFLRYCISYSDKTK